MAKRHVDVTLLIQQQVINNYNKIRHFWTL